MLYITTYIDLLAGATEFFEPTTFGEELFWVFGVSSTPAEGGLASCGEVGLGGTGGGGDLAFCCFREEGLGGTGGGEVSFFVGIVPEDSIEKGS